MRVVLVGSTAARSALRRQLTSDIEVVGEARSAAEARGLGLDADAFLLAPADRDEREAPDTFAEPLTPRELEVLELVAEGLSNKAIATQLSISDQTVKFHVRSICDKLGAANRTDAVRRALRRGLLSI